LPELEYVAGVNMAPPFCEWWRRVERE
jgi:hypothetical protein